MAKGIDNGIFPVDCITPEDKLEFAYRAEQLLIDLHNWFVEWREVGKTELEWAQYLPGQIKDRFPYELQITMVTWQRFINEEWKPRMESCHEELLKHRNSVIGQPDQDNEEASTAYSNAKQNYKNSNRWPDLNPGDINKFMRT